MAVQQWQSGNLLSGSMNPSSALGVAANASGNMFTQLTQAQQIADIEREREWRRNELKRADARRSEIAGQADKLFNEEDLAAQARINAMGSDALLSEIGQGNWQVGENPGMLLYSNNDNLQAGFRDRGERETAADYIKAQRAAAFAPGTDFSDGITEFRGRGERETAEDYLKAMRGPAAAERLAKQTARDSRIMDSRTATDEILAGKKDEILSKGREKLLSNKGLYLDGNAIEGRMRDTMTNMGYTDAEIQSAINPKLDPIFGRNDPVSVAAQMKALSEQVSPFETFGKAFAEKAGANANKPLTEAEQIAQINVTDKWLETHDDAIRKGSEGFFRGLADVGNPNAYQDDVRKYVMEMQLAGSPPSESLVLLSSMMEDDTFKNYDIGKLSKEQIMTLSGISSALSGRSGGSGAASGPSYEELVRDQLAWQNNQNQLMNDIQRSTSRKTFSDDQRKAIFAEQGLLNESGLSRVDNTDAALKGISGVSADDLAYANGLTDVVPGTPAGTGSTPANDDRLLTTLDEKRTGRPFNADSSTPGAQAHAASKGTMDVYTSAFQELLADYSPEEVEQIKRDLNSKLSADHTSEAESLEWFKKNKDTVLSQIIKNRGFKAGEAAEKTATHAKNLETYKSVMTSALPKMYNDEQVKAILTEFNRQTRRFDSDEEALAWFAKNPEKIVKGIAGDLGFGDGRSPIAKPNSQLSAGLLSGNTPINPIPGVGFENLNRPNPNALLGNMTPSERSIGGEVPLGTATAIAQNPAQRNLGGPVPVGKAGAVSSDALLGGNQSPTSQAQALLTPDPLSSRKAAQLQGVKQLMQSGNLNGAIQELEAVMQDPANAGDEKMIAIYKELISALQSQIR